MNFFAIGDLHLSGNPPTHPMDVFGPHWDKHWERIRSYWQDHVKADDVVFILGDTSWALHLDEALPDLKAIAQLPGKKYIIRGNHDYWWSSLRKMNIATEEQFTFLQGRGAMAIDGHRAVAFGGSRAYLCPNDSAFKEETDLSIYKRELLRVEAALQEMDQLLKQARQENPSIREEVRILLLHYPPFNDENEASGFTELMEKYKVDHCLFGHLHDENSFKRIPANFGATPRHLASADYLHFTLKEIL